MRQGVDQAIRAFLQPDGPRSGNGSRYLRGDGIGVVTAPALLRKGRSRNRTRLSRPSHLCA